ncbi:hypothetical protein [Paenibacillus borealis]|uniref:Uncharacterized protein n=1 Tax=Paenibacillus borealis TaxID=160799 RepID=A0A089LGG0_PAEBO|nr:hypothetical protein [Paenibacillus borealis]AIQ60616.1 hypothetical protein PBOR_29490 [Paenibacillus borealis]
MPNIKNLDLITAKVNDFTLNDLKFITDFRYWVEVDTVQLFDEYNTPMLMINFVLMPKGDKPTYKVSIHFKKVGSLQLSATGTVIQLSWFEILNISDRGWDSVKYLVRDFENEDRFKFYCDDIEVIAIEEIDWIIG